MGCTLFGVNTLWLADPDAESNLSQLCLFVFFQTLFPTNSLHEPCASSKPNYATRWYLFFSHFSTVPISLPDLLLPPLSCPNSRFLSAAFSATSPTEPKKPTSSLNNHSSLYLTITLLELLISVFYFPENICLMTWSLCHLFSFGQLPSSILATHFEWMTKPHFSSYVESICDGLFFIAANEDKLSHGVWLS